MKRKAKTDWPAENVELWPIEKIIPYEQNARIHPDKQIELLAKLMLRHGIDQPIVVDEKGIILKGHGRRLAAITAGFKQFPVVIHRGLNDIQKQDIRIGDNKITILAGWDDELLRMQINELRNAGFDLPMLGFDQGELNAFGLEMLKGENNVLDEWQGMPEFLQDDKTAFRSIVVHFVDEKALEKFQKLLRINIPEKQRYIWYPAIKIEKYVDKQYVGKSV